MNTKDLCIIILVLLLGVFLPSIVCSQAKVIKETRRIWDADSEVWQPVFEKSWKYDGLDRLVKSTHQAKYGLDSLPYYSKTESWKFDKKGNLILFMSELSDDTVVTKKKDEYVYDEHQQQVLHTFSASYPPSIELIPRVRREFSYTDSANTKSGKEFKNIGLNTWRLEFIYDTLYNTNECIRETRFKAFHVGTGDLILHRRNIFTTDTNCNTLHYITYTKRLTDTLRFKLEYKYTCTSLEGGRVKEWRKYGGPTCIGLLSMSRTEKDNDGRTLRWYQKNSFGTPIEQEKINEYDPEGRLLYHSDSWDNFVYYDKSIIYNFDSLGKPIQSKEIHTNYWSNLSATITNFFSHNCDGLVDTLISDELPNVYQTVFEYDTVKIVDCTPKSKPEPEKEPITFSVFPNPNNGFFEIQSSFLKDQEASIRIISILGREVFRQTYQIPDDRVSIQLPHASPGRYIVIFQNANLLFTKKIEVN